MIEENGEMQANSTLFYTLYICIPALFIWVLLKRESQRAYEDHF